MNVTAGDERPVAVPADDVLRAEPFWTVMTVAPGSVLRARRPLVEVGCLGRDDTEVGVAEPGRIGRGIELRGEVVATGDAEAVLVQGLRVLLSRRASTITSVTCARCAAYQTADGAGPDDADPLDLALDQTGPPDLLQVGLDLNQVGVRVK
jgi:hypothetical protein